MRRTQLYLDEDLWNLLRVLARQSESTVSDLVRQAVREKYMRNGSERVKVFESVIGLWKGRTDLPDTEEYVRRLRRGSRRKRILK